MSALIHTNPLDILNGRTKRLDARYSYKLAGGQFALNAVVSDAAPEVDEKRMCFWLPYADGKRRDGVGDLLEVDGIRTERHRMNPIALFDHGKAVALPIGKCQDENGVYTNEIDPHSQVARAQVFVYQARKGEESLAGGKNFEHGQFCEQVFDLWCKRFLRSGSIGYQVVHAKQLSPDYETGTPQGLHLMVVNMLECSVVVLPANQDTTRKSYDPVRHILAMPKVCGMPLSPYLVKSLTPYAAEAPALVVGGFVGTKSNPMERKFSGSMAVPHGDHSKTNVPPPKMRPGWVQVVKNIRLGVRGKAAKPKKGPYEDGYAARIRNDKPEANPHPDGHPHREEWAKGHAAADADLAKKQAPPPQGGTKALPPGGGQQPRQSAQPKQPPAPVKPQATPAQPQRQRQQYPVAAPHTPPPQPVTPKPAAKPQATPRQYPVAAPHTPPPQAQAKPPAVAQQQPAPQEVEAEPSVMADFRHYGNVALEKARAIRLAIRNGIDVTGAHFREHWREYAAGLLGGVTGGLVGGAIGGPLGTIDHSIGRAVGTGVGMGVGRLIGRPPGKSLSDYEAKAKRGAPHLARPSASGKQRVHLPVKPGETVMVVRNIFGGEGSEELFARPRDMIQVLDDPYGDGRHGTFHALNQAGDTKEVSVADVRKVQGRMQKQPKPQVQDQGGNTAPKPITPGGDQAAKPPKPAQKPPHFSGVITTVDGRRVRYIDGKPVTMDGSAAPTKALRLLYRTKGWPKGKPKNPGAAPLAAPVPPPVTASVYAGRGRKLLELRRKYRRGTKKLTPPPAAGT